MKLAPLLLVVVLAAGCGGSGGTLADATTTTSTSTTLVTDVTNTDPTVPPGTQEIEPAALQADLQSNAVLFLIDVRSSDDYAAGHVPGAVNYDFRGGSFYDQIAPLNKDARIVVYGNVANRGAKVLAAMDDLGYTNVVQIAGGFDAWIAAGLPHEP